VPDHVKVPISVLLQAIRRLERMVESARGNQRSPDAAGQPWNQRSSDAAGQPPEPGALETS
jgi:hypothetical protein